jgi:hypothetical protein
MGKLTDLSEVEPKLVASAPNAVKYRFGGIVRSRRDFQRAYRAASLADDDDIGEGAADVDRNPVFFCIHRIKLTAIWPRKHTEEKM